MWLFQLSKNIMLGIDNFEEKKEKNRTGGTFIIIAYNLCQSALFRLRYRGLIPEIIFKGIIYTVTNKKNPTIYSYFQVLF